MPSGVSPYMTVRRSARRAVVDADAHRDVALFAGTDHGEQRRFNRFQLFLDFGLGIVLGALARLAEDEQAGIDPDLIDVFRDFDGDVAALVMHIGDERQSSSRVFEAPLGSRPGIALRPWSVLSRERSR